MAGNRMKKEVLVLDRDADQCKRLRLFLEKSEYDVTTMEALTGVNDYLETHDCRAAIFNLDTISVNNKILRKVKRKNPQMSIIALSIRQYHPELEEAMREDISVCLGIPVDFDELIYWLASIYENSENQAG
jgi:DNA-binding NtrC family response regulator